MPALPSGPLQDALHEALAQHAVADAHGHPLLRCEALSGLAQALSAACAHEAAEACLALALEAAAQMPAGTDLQADLACAMAEVCCKTADAWEADQRHDDAGPQPPPLHHPARERAHSWAHRAAQLARQVSDTVWQVRVLRHAAGVLERGGEVDDAACLERQALALEQPGHAARRSGPDAPLRHAAPRRAM